ncbi:MAG: aldehyde dehydrogenase [Rhizobacter sp.]|nr:aldehyde dehydrogenase [Rhizobacter sp.]
MSVAHYFDTMDYGPAFESDSDVRAWLQRHGDGFGHFIGGRAVPTGADTGSGTDSDTGTGTGTYTGSNTHTATTAGFETREPATGKPLARIAQGSAADVDIAVQAARAAQPAWFALGGHGRARHLYALARMVQRHARLFAVLQALDSGRPIHAVRDHDLPQVARQLYHHAGWAQLQEREFADSLPLGVIGQIFPSSLSLSTLARAAAPALALGNTVVLKPSNGAALGALLFAELAAQAGLPAGVLNMVTGDGATGAALVAHEGVDKIVFSGSPEVGRLIRQATAGTGKSLSLALGGRQQCIVFDDADLDAAVEGMVESICLERRHMGDSGPRLLVQEVIAADFIERLKRRLRSVRTGTPLDKTIDMSGPIHPGPRDERGQRDEGSNDGSSRRDEREHPSTPSAASPQSAASGSDDLFTSALLPTTFRTPDEAITLANHMRSGLAASVWTENTQRAMSAATQLQTGTVWINATHLFDASVGIGGVRESGFGLDGGREGCHEYLQPRTWAQRRPRRVSDHGPVVTAPPRGEVDAGGRFGATRAGDTGHAPAPAIDRTAKLFIGGKQVRPDSESSTPVFAATGQRAGEVAAGSRKDIRNAVTAARAAVAWSSATPHRRAQALYYLAENLSARADEFATRIASLTGLDAQAAHAEVEASIGRLFAYGAWADKYEGTVQLPAPRSVALSTVEPIGVVGVVCPEEAPLLSLVSLMAPLMAMGNRTIIVPSQRHALVATDFYQVLETSDLPAGVVNLVTGPADALLQTLAEHDDVDALWAFGDAPRSCHAERLSVGNLKRTLVDHDLSTDWNDAASAEGPLFLRHATRVKSIWLPCAE